MSDDHPRNLDPFEDLVAEIATPGFKPYTLRHPSGLVGVHRGTHLSVYARHPSDPQGEATNLVARVVFDNTPKDRASAGGWPDELDAIGALDDTARRLGQSGLTPEM